MQPVDPVQSTRSAHSAPPQQSAPALSFVRASLAAYTFLIVYASWYPFSGWRDMGIGPFDYLTTPLPYYWTLFDLLTNLAGYAPFGFLMALALHPRVTGIAAVMLGVLTALLLSGTMEAVQTWLPSRVSSNLDLYSNTAGALIGALVAAALRYRLLESDRLHEVGERWLANNAGRGLVIVALWPLAQIYPVGHFFGLGQLLGAVSGWISALLTEPVDIATWLLNGAQLSIEQYSLAESVIAACGMVGGVLTLLTLLRAEAPRLLLAATLIAAALIIRLFSSALFFAPENALVSFTPAAWYGLAAGALALLPLAWLPLRWQRRIASYALIGGLFVVNLLPPNPYFIATLQAGSQGKFLNFNGAAQFLSILWPFLALWFLTGGDARKRPRGRPPR